MALRMQVNECGQSSRESGARRRKLPRSFSSPILQRPLLMNKAFSIALLIAGVVLLIYGINAHGSIVSEAKEAVTGTPTDKSLWFIILGIIGIIVGGIGTLARRRID